LFRIPALSSGKPLSEWAIYGSNDSKNWDLIDSKTDIIQQSSIIAKQLNTFLSSNLHLLKM
jgi:hypothetical protein